jgi:hypothetical protein
MTFHNKAIPDAKRPRRNLAVAVFVFLLIALDDKLPRFSGLDRDVGAAEGTLVVAIGFVGVGEVKPWVVLEIFCIDTE